MTVALPPGACGWGDALFWEPSVGALEELPEATRLVLVSAERDDWQGVPARVRGLRPQAQPLIYFPSAASAAVAQALRCGYGDVALGPEHLQLRLERWRKRRVGEGDVEQFLALVFDMAARPGLQEVLRSVVLRAPMLFGFAQAAVVVFKGGTDVAFVVAAGAGEQLENLVIHQKDFPDLRELARRRSSMSIDLAAAEALTEGAHGRSVKDASAILCPLWRKHQVVGALLLVGGGEARPLEQLPKIGNMLSSVTSVALGNALEQDMLLSTQRDLMRQREDARQELLNLRQFSDVFDQSFDGILITDAHSAIRYANPSAAAMLQRKSEALRDTRFFELLGSRSASLAARAYDGDPVGDAYGYVDLILDAPSQDTVLSAAIRPLAEDGGVLVTFRDVTELREIENELRHTKDFLEQLIGSSVDAIVAANFDGRIVIFNRSAEQVLGYSAREVMNRTPLAALFGPGEGDDLLRRLRSDAYGGRGRLELTRKDMRSRKGELVPVNLTATVIYEGDRETAVVFVFTDLRERLRMEEKLTLVQQRLRHTERQAVAVELAGAAAHELNQPLTSILGYAELLRQRLAGDEQKKAVETLATQAERMAAIVKKIGQITSYETRAYVGGSRTLGLDDPGEDK